MIVTILLFASAREKVGTSKLSLTFEDKEEVSLIELVSQIQTNYPSLHLLEQVNSSANETPTIVNTLNFAINKKYNRDPSCVIRNGDEVAIIPPISGG